MKNRKTIVFGKNEFEFFFGLSFLGEFLDEQNITLEQIDEKLNRNPFKFIPTSIVTGKQLFFYSS